MFYIDYKIIISLLYILQYCASFRNVQRPITDVTSWRPALSIENWKLTPSHYVIVQLMDRCRDMVKIYCFWYILFKCCSITSMFRFRELYSVFVVLSSLHQDPDKRISMLGHAKCCGRFLGLQFLHLSPYSICCRRSFSPLDLATAPWSKMRCHCRSFSVFWRLILI